MSAAEVRLAVLSPPAPLAAVAALEQSLRRSHPRAELRLEVDDVGALVVMAELSPPPVDVVDVVVRSGSARARAVLEAVAEVFEVTVDQVVGRTRHREVIPARQAAMALCRELTDLSFPAIAAIFGRDHTTVVHGVAATARRVAASSDHAELVERARRLFHARDARLPGLEPLAREGRPVLRAVAAR